MLSAGDKKDGVQVICAWVRSVQIIENNGTSVIAKRRFIQTERHNPLPRRSLRHMGFKIVVTEEETLYSKDLLVISWQKRLSRDIYLCGPRDPNFRTLRGRWGGGIG